VTIEDVSESTAALALQGPNARVILQQLVSVDLETLRYFRIAGATIRGIPVIVSRTGYTGDLGYEIWVDASRALPLWDALIEAGTPYGVTPCGLLALDIARIEAGLILLDVDYVPAHRALIESQKSSPFELNLGWAVKLEKPAFVGRAALAAEAARGPGWNLVGLETEWDAFERLYAEVGLPPRLPTAAWRTSVPVYVGRDQVATPPAGAGRRCQKSLAFPPRPAPDRAEVDIEVTVDISAGRPGPAWCHCSSIERKRA
jgi:aminomethyltransferase